MDYRSIIEQNKEAYLSELFEVLRQKSISAQNDGIRECAELVADKLQAAGMQHVELMETEIHPVVYGEYHVSDDVPTILIYGHYDVQPPDPLEAWDSPPFEPTIRDGRIYARGAGDNKGQMMAQVLAIQTYLEAEGTLPVNVKFLIEGEEEIGSVNLADFVDTHRDKLKADLVYASDGPMLPDDHPYVLLGVRGIMYVELELTEAAFDNHSGNKGNIVPNPAWKLMDLLHTMRDADGNVLMEGFYDDVLPPTDQEMALLEKLPFDLEEVKRNVGHDGINMSKADYYRKLCFEPTFNIAGFTSGYGGEGAKTIIPKDAKVKIDMRLVMNQDPEKIFQLLKAHVEKHAPDVTVKPHGRMSPSRTSADMPFIEPIRQAAEKAFGKTAYIQPSLGGSLPDAVWTKVLGVPSVLVPYANVDEANHSPNENIRVENFFNGIETTCHIIDVMKNINM